MHGGTIAALSLASRTSLSSQQLFWVSLRPARGCIAYRGSLSEQLGKMFPEMGLKQEWFTHPWFFCSCRKCHGPPKQALQPHSLHLHRHIGPAVLPTPLPPLQVQPGQIPCCIARAAGPAQSQRPQDLCWQPQAGSIQLGGTRQDTSLISTASQLPPGVSCCRARLMHQIQCVNTSPTLVLQSCSLEVNEDIPWCQRCSFCAVSCSWFCCGHHESTDQIKERK